MLIYGLTGGIGSGKSTVAKMFEDTGIPIYDTDEIGKKLTQPGRALTRKIINHFPGCQTNDETNDKNQIKSIDRKKLAELVFLNPVERQWLEDLLHPAICSQLAEETKNNQSGSFACIAEGAVFLESNYEFPVSGMVVVHCPLNIRMERVRKRDKLDTKQIEQRLLAQLPQHQKILKATHLVNNGGSLQATRVQVQIVTNQLNREYGEKNNGC